MTTLVSNVAQDKARNILETHRHFTLSAADWRAFIATLDDPPDPNDALKAAWRDYHDAGLGDAGLG